MPISLRPLSHPYMTTTSAQVRLIRLDRELRLPEAAKLLGMTVAELSGLETGSLEPENPSDWDVILKTLWGSR